MKTIRMFAAGFMVALSFLGCRKDELKPEGELVLDGYGSDDLINDTQAYVYDAGSQTLTVTNVNQGKSSSWGSERKDLVFSVSADKTGLTCMFDRIYSTSSPNKYVDLKGLTLTAETIQ